MAKHDDWDWLRGQVLQALDEFRAQLETVSGDMPVPNLDWTVAELTAHLASLPGLYARQHELGDSFEVPDDWAAFSVAARAHIDTSDLDAVSGLLATEIAAHLDAVEDPDGSRWLYGRRTTERNLAGALLAELVIHGQDLGRLTGAKPTLSRDQAAAALGNTFAILPAFVDPARASKAVGVYHFGFRGSGDYTVEIRDDGTVSAEPGRPDRADARTSADPAAFLLVSLGRVNQFVPALTGKIVAYGRKPWKLLAAGNIAVDGV